MTTTPQIVTVNTTVEAAPQPSQLQQSGAIVSAGGTTLTTGTYQYCASLKQVQSILSTPLAIQTLSWSGGITTVTASSALGLTSGQTFTTTISGAAPAGFNGTFTATVTGSDTFTYALTTNPGSVTTEGFYTPATTAFVSDAATTFFAQSGTTIGLWVLELGAQSTAAAAITALETFITDQSPQVFYAYLVPPSFDANAATNLATMVSNYDSPSGQTYFFITTTSANVSDYATYKSAFTVVPSPTQASTEVQAASMFYQWLVNNPGPGNALAPMSYRYLYGVTPWVRTGNQTTINAVLSANGNLILTGSEGGISDSVLFKGLTMDGAQASYWYGVDYYRIQVQQALAAAVINGSNTQPPLLYDQSGINALQAVSQRVANNAVSYGCAQSITIAAVPFSTYVAQFPSNYADGIYDGLSATLVGQNGFLTITFNLSAVQFAG